MTVCVWPRQDHVTILVKWGIYMFMYMYMYMNMYNYTTCTCMSTSNCTKVLCVIEHCTRSVGEQFGVGRLVRVKWPSCKERKGEGEVKDPSTSRSSCRIENWGGGTKAAQLAVQIYMEEAGEIK